MVIQITFGNDGIDLTSFEGVTAKGQSDGIPCPLSPRELENWTIDHTYLDALVVNDDRSLYRPVITIVTNDT